MIDFQPVRDGEKTMQQLAASLTRAELANLTNEMVDTQLAALAKADDEDIVLVPDDPGANDTFATDPDAVNLSWTMGHVIVHVTASSEESAALALTLARGLEVTGRSRYETPWEEATSVDFVRRRLEDSRRMRLAMLEAWPDPPHLDNYYRVSEERPPMNALARFLSGLSHDDSHLGQIRGIMAQGRARHPR